MAMIWNRRVLKQSSDSQLLHSGYGVHHYHSLSMLSFRVVIEWLGILLHIRDVSVQIPLKLLTDSSWYFQAYREKIFKFDLFSHN